MQGYKSKIRLSVSIDVKTDQVIEVEVLEHHETPSYACDVTEKWFLKRFEGKKANQDLEIVKMMAEDQNEVVAITGATITSNAVAKGVNVCMENYREIKEAVLDEIFK